MGQLRQPRENAPATGVGGVWGTVGGLLGIAAGPVGQPQCMLHGLDGYIVETQAIRASHVERRHVNLSSVDARERT
jgi:hypothetical protein